MSFLDRGERSADAVAATDTDLFMLSRQRFDERHKPCYGVRFARPTTLAAGDDACRFQFSKVAGPDSNA